MYVRPSGKYWDSGDLYPFTFLEDTLINPIQIKEGRWADYAHHIDLSPELLGPGLGGRLRPPQRLGFHLQRHLLWVEHLHDIRIWWVTYVLQPPKIDDWICSTNKRFIHNEITFDLKLFRRSCICVLVRVLFTKERGLMQIFQAP